MTIPEQAVDAALDAYHGTDPEGNWPKAARDRMKYALEAALPSLVGVQRPEDVARALKMVERVYEIHKSYECGEAIRILSAVLALPHTGQPQEGEAECIVERELGSIEVDARGSCKWTDVANAMTHAKAQLRRLSAAPASPRAEGEHERELQLSLSELEAEAGRYSRLIREGIFCEFDDKCIPLSVDDDSDPSVGLYGAPYLALPDTHEILPKNFLEMVKESMGDNWDRIVDLHHQAPALPAPPVIAEKQTGAK